MRKHTVIIIPGLGDRSAAFLSLAVHHWKSYELEPVIHGVHWHKGKDFNLKLNVLTDLIDRYSDTGIVSLVGTSAGGSAALNAFFERKGRVHRVVNVCGRLIVGPTTGFRSFESKSKSSPAFAKSVRLSESRIHLLHANEKKRIMTVRPMFGDELVPKETTTVVGAYNLAIPTAGHMMSIGLALTIFCTPLITFLKSN